MVFKGHLITFQLDGDTLTQLSSVDTGPVARTSYFDKHARRMYVAVPQCSIASCTSSRGSGGAVGGGGGGGGNASSSNSSESNGSRADGTGAVWVFDVGT